MYCNICGEDVRLENIADDASVPGFTVCIVCYNGESDDDDWAPPQDEE